MSYLHFYLFILISQQADKNNESMYLGKIDASQHPEYTRLMSQLDQSKYDRLQKVQNWQKLERQSIHDWFAAQKKQAWDDFYVSILFIHSQKWVTSVSYSSFKWGNPFLFPNTSTTLHIFVSRKGI